MIESAAVQVTTEEMRDSFKEMLTDAEDWLYMDPEADKAEAEIFKAKLDVLRAVGDPMHIRMYEMQRRPDRMKKALELTDVVAMATNSWLETRPWLNSTRVETLRETVRLAGCILYFQLMSGGLWLALQMFVHVDI